MGLINKIFFTAALIGSFYGGYLEKTYFELGLGNLESLAQQYKRLYGENFPFEK